MRLVYALVIVAALALTGMAQTLPCACGKHPPGPPAPRSLKPYANEPDDLRPFSKFPQHFAHLPKSHPKSADPNTQLNSPASTSPSPKVP
jgi:hypothetical protein